MWWIRCFGYIVPLFFTAFALLLTGAIAQQPPQAPPSSQPAKPAKADKPAAPVPLAPKADPQATKALETAAAMVDPQKTGWQETTLRQSVHTQGFSYKSEGRYLAGPDQHMRMDLKVLLGKTDGQMTVVSDGATVWNMVRVGTEAPAVIRWDLKKVNDMLNSPGMPPKLRDQFYRNQSFVGLVPFMDSLRKEMVFTKLENGRWENHDVLKLTGVWSEEVSKAICPPPNSWPVSVPRTCLCYLDKTTYWPHRVEWLGPDAPEGDDVRLTEIEFRDPKFVKGAAVPVQMVSLFTFDPGKNQVIDQTQQIIAGLNNERAQQARSASPAPVPPASTTPPATTPPASTPPQSSAPAPSSPAGPKK